MEKFGHQEYRNEFAKKLKSVHANGGKETANRILDEEKETPFYKASKLIQELKRMLPSGCNDFLRQETTPEEDSEEIKEKFEIINISERIPKEIWLQIEAEIIEDFMYIQSVIYDSRFDAKKYLDIMSDIKDALGFVEKYEWQKRAWGVEDGRGFFDEVTEGELLNPRNISHSVMGQKRPNDKRLASFKVDSVIDPSPEDKGLWFAEGKYSYARQLGRPLVILSTTSTNSRTFLESNIFLDDLDDVRNGRKSASTSRDNLLRNKGGEIKFQGNCEPRSDFLTRLMLLANMPICGEKISISLSGQTNGTKFSWADVGKIIVNLRHKKIYKRKLNQDETNIQKSINDYRKVLTDVLGYKIEDGMFLDKPYC